MIHIDEQALFCDLAETYGIFDYRSMPATIVAKLACGLREDSRIMSKIEGREAGRKEILLAIVADRMADVVTTLGGYESRPERILPKLLCDDKADNVEIYTVDEFDRIRSEILGGGSECPKT